MRRRDLRPCVRKRYCHESGYPPSILTLVVEPQDELILHRILYKLYHIEESIDQNVREIKTQNKALAGLREEQRVHDEALAEARAEQAKVRTTVMQKEKKIKKAEKTLDGKVCRVSRCAQVLD